jgi:hypothetical protein
MGVKARKRARRRDRRLAKQRPGRLPKKAGIVGHGTALTVSHEQGPAHPTTPEEIRNMLLRRVRR